MGKAEDARATSRQGYNCTQAVLSAFSEDYGLDPVMAYKVAAGFGGGMGHMGETCGAVTGAFMVIGLKYGLTVTDGSQSTPGSIRHCTGVRCKIRGQAWVDRLPGTPGR